VVEWIQQGRERQSEDMGMRTGDRVISLDSSGPGDRLYSPRQHRTMHNIP
jgi:hypothetical protein